MMIVDLRDGLLFNYSDFHYCDQKNILIDQIQNNFAFVYEHVH